MNRIGPAALTDVIFDAEVWTNTVQASDTYVLTKRKPAEISLGDASELLRSMGEESENAPRETLVQISDVMFSLPAMRPMVATL
mmetsp:Transcript_121506/g.192357  ORF Transcript_121506/g.192357 Transcript_121506/m.192357 type:complete len:84 (-) Transcript_121506:43-294(-)